MKDNKDLGLLILRLGIGAMFVHHGFFKLSAGQTMWTQIGGAMSNLGINFAPTAFGLAASCSEFFGGICLILGLFVRPASCFMLFTMLVATTMHFSHGDGLNGAAHAIDDGIIFLSLIFLGAGDLTVKKLLKK
jgi:putative oxidoreductase